MPSWLPPYVIPLSLRYIAAFAIALGIGLALTPCVRELARRVGMIDKPDPRRVNKVPIPRGGGLAVFAAFHLTMFIMAFLAGGFDQVTASGYYFAFLAGSSVLAVIGLLDDAFNLKAILKLFGQIAVAFFLCRQGMLVNLPFEWAQIPLVQYGLTIAWIVGIINAFNLIDGLDGLASGLALIASIGMIGSIFFAQNYVGIIPYLVFCGALLAFLRYNFNPASVFLGDTGSMFIGLLLATLPLATHNQENLIVSAGVPVLCMGIPVLDTALAIIRRSVRAILCRLHPDGHADGIMRADRDHIHHRMLLRHGSQRSAVYILYALAIFLVSAGYCCVILHEKASGVFLLAFLAFSLIIVRYMTNIEIWDTGRLLSERRNSTFRRSLTIPLYLACDFIAFFICWLLACYICRADPVDPLMLKLFPAFCAPIFLTLFIFKHYARSWSQARQRDQAIIPFAVLLGFAVSHLILFFTLQPVAHEYRSMQLCFSLLCIIPLWISRITRAGVLQSTSLIENHRMMSSEDPRIERTLIYGAGYHMHSYINAFVYNLGCNRECIVGVVDDNPNLKGAYVCDVRVIGTLADLEGEFTRYNPTRILICANLLPPAKDALASFATTHCLALHRWESSEIPVLPAELLQESPPP